MQEIGADDIAEMPTWNSLAVSDLPSQSNGNMF